MADGYRESAESWADLLRDCARRGMRAPVLAVGDGALGFWKALAEVFPDTRHQRCWVHKTANVANALPKSAQPGAKKAMQEIYNAEDREHAVKAITAFEKCLQLTPDHIDSAAASDTRAQMLSWRWPGVSRSASGRPLPSQARWILVVSPPRDRPRA